VRAKVVTVINCCAQDEVNQQKNGQNVRFRKKRRRTPGVPASDSATRQLEGA